MAKQPTRKSLDTWHKKIIEWTKTPCVQNALDCSKYELTIRTKAEKEGLSKGVTEHTLMNAHNSILGGQLPQIRLPKDTPEWLLESCKVLVKISAETGVAEHMRTLTEKEQDVLQRHLTLLNRCICTAPSAYQITPEELTLSHIAGMAAYFEVNKQ